MPATYTPASVRLNLIAEVGERLYIATESWEYKHVGSDLAYLFWAIAKDDQVEWHPGETVALMLQQFPREHAVWRHIIILNPEGTVHDSRINAREAQ